MIPVVGITEFGVLRRGNWIIVFVLPWNRPVIPIIAVCRSREPSSDHPTTGFTNVNKYEGSLCPMTTPASNL
jgi:hypothetical protein